VLLLKQLWNMTHVVCAADEVQRVAEHATRMCDGHPMFLSFVSSIAAPMAKGRLFTPTFLDWVADRIIKGNGTESLGIVRKDFYAHQLNELDCLDQRGRSLAKSLWATVARYTTTDFPWLDNARVFDLSGVQEFAQTRDLETERQLLHARHHRRKSYGNCLYALETITENRSDSF